MLISKGFTTGDVVTFKLVSGEEMIARYQGETTTEYQISKPATLMPTDHGTLGLMPTVFSADLNSTTITMQKTAIVLVAPAKKDMADQYTSATSSIKPASNIPTGIMK